MPRTPSRPKSKTSQALISLRSRLGDNQAEFAKRVGLAIQSIARYETSNPPTGRALIHFAKLAKETGAVDEAQILREAYLSELRERDGVWSLVEQLALQFALAGLKNELERSRKEADKLQNEPLRQSLSSAQTHFTSLENVLSDLFPLQTA